MSKPLPDIVAVRGREIRRKGRSAWMMRILATTIAVMGCTQVALSAVAPSGPMDHLQIAAGVAVIMIIWFNRLLHRYSRAEVARGLAGDLITLHGIAMTRARTMPLTMSGNAVAVRYPLRGILEVGARVSRERTERQGPQVVGRGLMTTIEHFPSGHAFTAEDVAEIARAMAADPDRLEFYVLLLELIATSHGIEWNHRSNKEIRA